MEKKNTNRLLKSTIVPLIMVAIMIAVYFLEFVGVGSFRQWGIRPREIDGLWGILFSPFLHGSREHLFNNSIPTLVLGSALFYFYREIAWKTLIWIMLMGGFWVWVSARAHTNHIGMSGIVYGLVSFLFLSGILRKHIGLIAISMLMVFMYGSLIWGIFPIKEGVSWEGHLWGAISGVILAWYLQKEGVQRKLYQWELDEIAEEQELERLRNLPPEEIQMTSSSEAEWDFLYEWKEKESKEEK